MNSFQTLSRPTYGTNEKEMEYDCQTGTRINICNKFSTSKITPIKIRARSQFLLLVHLLEYIALEQTRMSGFLWFLQEENLSCTPRKGPATQRLARQTHPCQLTEESLKENKNLEREKQRRNRGEAGASEHDAWPEFMV